MKVAIMCSEKDEASMNIREQLLDLFDFEEEGMFNNNPTYKLNHITIYTLKEHSIYAENVDKEIDANRIIFASKHASKEAVHSLSCHVLGNWNDAKFGGKNKSLSKASAYLLKKAYLELLKYKEEVPDHRITLEATHHGPYLETPSVFVEIGSNEHHWKDKNSGVIIAKVIMELTKEIKSSDKVAVGLGGGHYCPSFNKVLERTGIALSHICPKFNLEFVDEKIIKETLEKTEEKVDFILLDWKGLGKEKQRIVELLNNLNIEYKRTDKL